MTSIRKKTKPDGTVVYDCAITDKNHRVIVHRESKTFLKQKQAKDWGFKREVELQETAVYKRAKYQS